MIGYAKTARTVLVVVIASYCLSACGEYVDRKNTIAFSAGNAVQTNIVTHVIDPWPASSRNRYFATDGQRMQRAVENYRCGKVAEASNNGNGGGSSEGASSNGEGTC
ncbi:hypothetical protein BB934_30335 (plasmid) [Microvirga ossetica]|uniref:Uncharacterized protein n=1 Tax=Microvirga ossetica TaxID=1882682 RepID=A0A1B2ERH6_9HYPH|nr:hypothetical protein [Microvirga ossetica]ANY82575.1 hypothetical protein BB934_30335 [Microvirga ossetica]